MRLLKFTLSGKTAFFKKPDVNTYVYFTYGQIHKVALLGIFGAILGYGGYSQMAEGDVFPEFYEKLKDLQLSIIPRNKHGFIPKKIQAFNNSVGYASFEQGGNLIVKEQWLESPEWDIYVKLDHEESRKLSDAVLNKQSVFIPYLGKNDHVADIKSAYLIEDAADAGQVTAIDSLAPYEWLMLDWDEDEIEGTPFKYEEYLPISLDEESNLYQLQRFLFTNLPIEDQKCQVIRAEQKNLVFY